MSELIDVVMQELAQLGWQGFQAVNGRIPEGKSPEPGWAPGPLLKSRQRTKPPLGWPRQTDSLCPRCVIETRAAILEGRRDLADLVDGHGSPPVQEDESAARGRELNGLEKAIQYQNPRSKNVRQMAPRAKGERREVRLGTQLAARRFVPTR